MKLLNTHVFWVRGIKLVVGFCACGVGFAAPGQQIHLESAGARFGFYPFGAGHGFYQVEGYVSWNLPWSWDLGSSWNLQSAVGIAAGWLGESGAEAFIASAGPSLVLGRQKIPLSIEAGVSPTILTRTEFPSKDFGIPFQFTSHTGLNFDFSGHLRLIYRFQHMSNAGLSRRNPGLNLHMVGLSYIF